jgi:hypothetical protein
MSSTITSRMDSQNPDMMIGGEANMWNNHFPCSEIEPVIGRKRWYVTDLEGTHDAR